MKCERCGKRSDVENPFALWGYCWHCSENLCPHCMGAGKCRESADGKHTEAVDEQEVLDENR